VKFITPIPTIFYEILYFVSIIINKAAVSNKVFIFDSNNSVKYCMHINGLNTTNINLYFLLFEPYIL
jgi:hypothetical protein